MSTIISLTFDLFLTFCRPTRRRYFLHVTFRPFIFTHTTRAKINPAHKIVSEMTYSVE